jgi:membrane-bound serine protease (ClpP class)
MELHRPHATRRSAASFRRLLAGALLAAGVAMVFTDAAAGEAGSAGSLEETALAPSTNGGAAGEAGHRGIGVVQVEGLLDPPNVTLLQDAITDANDQHLTMLLVQIDSTGAVSDPRGLVRSIERSRVPVVAWVGPSGADANGSSTLLVEAAHAAFAAQGSEIGDGHPTRLDDPSASSPRLVRAELAGLAARNGRDPDAAARLATSVLSARDAARSGAIDGVRPTIGEVIVKLDGKTLRTAAGDVELSTAKVIGKGRDRRRQPNQDVVFNSLGLGGQLQHALISPSTAYFLLLAGLALIVFEFFAASVGFAGVVGALAVVGAGYGFSHLPVHWWGLALLVISAFGFAVDAQAGDLGFWTGVGGIGLVAGSLTLYGGDSELRPAWWVLLVVCAGTILFYVFAVPSFIRARFSTPTIGREGMIGELGTAEVPVAPDGVVTIRGARWRARTNRATPVGAGEAVRVIAVEGVVLEVEPEAGGAKDYRDRARRKPEPTE